MSHHIQVLPRMPARVFIAAALATTVLSAQATTQTDPVTGQVWDIFYNVSEGLAQGYRRATVDDFKQLLADSNWLPREGTTSVYDFTSGVSNSSQVNTPNINFGFYRGTSLPNSILASSAQAAWLQDGDASDALGVVEKGWSVKPATEWSCESHMCWPLNTQFYYNNTAEVVHASDLTTKFAAGNSPSTFTGTSYSGTPLADHPFDPLVEYRNFEHHPDTGNDTYYYFAGTFMITSVPEPANAALLSLGLMGIVAAVRVRRSQQNDHLG